jgi:hypothetical protein
MGTSKGAGAASRRLEMSIVRSDVESGSPSQTVSQPLWLRFGRKPDHPVCFLPRTDAFPFRQRGLSIGPAHSNRNQQILMDVFTLENIRDYCPTSSDLPTCAKPLCSRQLHRIRFSGTARRLIKRRPELATMKGNEGCPTEVQCFYMSVLE